MTSIHKKVTKLMRQLSFSNSSEGGNDGGDPGVSSRRHNPLMKSKSGNSIPTKQHSRGSFERKSSKIKGSEAGSTSASTSCFLQNYLTSDQTRQPQPEIKFGKSEHDLPALKLSWMKSEVISACTGPDVGIGIINPSRSHFAPKEPDISFIDYDKDTDTSASETRIGEFSTDQNDNHAPHLSGSSLVASARLGEIARVRDWNSHSEHAFGKAVSLYEVNPVTSTKAGDPIADTFAVVGRQNNGIIAVADGVNWGEKARLAARCAVYGSVDYLNRALFEGRPRKFTTTDVFTALLRSFDAAHRLILAEEAALTTLACAVVAPLDRTDKFVACVCNVGDSLAYVYSQASGVREITKGSHCIDLVRDMRDALGALGPVDGQNPELNNLTCSMTVVEKGDIVFLTSDGVSDNFDPVVGKFAAAEKVEKEVKANAFPSLNLKDKSSSKSGLQSVSALQRHDLTSVRIEDILKNGIDGSGEGCKTAKKVCESLIDFVYRLTSGKRNILEDKDLYYDSDNKLLEPSEHRARRKQICQRIGMMPGKLDHACVVAYTVGDLGGPATKSPRERQRDSRQSSPVPPPFPVLEPRNSSHTLYDNVRLEPRRRKDEINRANRSRKEAALRESQPKMVEVKESIVPQKSLVSITNPSGNSWSQGGRSCSSEQVRSVTSSSHEQVHPLLKDSKGLVETVV